MSSYTLKWWLKEHPIRSSRGLDIQAPQTAVLKHPIFNSAGCIVKVYMYFLGCKERRKVLPKHIRIKKVCGSVVGVN